MPNVVGNIGTKGGPQIQAPFGQMIGRPGGAGLGAGYDIGGGGYGRKRFPQFAAPFTPTSRETGQPDPNGPPQVNTRGAYPGLYPTYRDPGSSPQYYKQDWVPSAIGQRVSQGALALGGVNFGRGPSEMGSGFGVTGPMDSIRKLLQARFGGGF